jgi:hypothetical protein
LFKGSEVPEPKPEPRKPGRPKLSESEAKGRIVPIRFAPESIQRIENAARLSNERVSEWVRRSLEEAQLIKLMVRVVDDADNKYDWFIGPPQACPPLPRLGEYVDCPAGSGTVQSIEHAIEEINTKRAESGSGPWDTYYKVLIRIHS